MKKEEEEFPIEVSSRIIKHISRGIYRSPAGALKELVSNSYDAGARKVTINTNYPFIDKIVATDNGNGMTLIKFQEIIRQIGISNKDVGQEVKVLDSIAKRKTIGNYGIGFLAMGQIAEEAIITSKVQNSNTGFQARIDFKQFDEVSAKIPKNDKDSKHFPIGKCYLKTVSFGSEFNKDHFTKIELKNIRVDVKRKIKGDTTTKLNQAVESQKQYIPTFNDIIRFVRDKEQGKDSFKQNKDVPKIQQYFYEKLLWELAVYAPVEYPNQEIFTKGDLKYFAKIASKSDFELIVDGFILKKPFDDIFWENRVKNPLTIFKYEDETYYKNYKVSGYVIFQDGTMIRPKVMQGILIRENGVAVGLYDKTYMSYPFFEGSKFDHLTGEIFADGLSDAMNVDRDSFNETHDAYIALAEWFHAKLYKEIFTTVGKIQEEKRKKSDKDDSVKLLTTILQPFIKSNKRINKINFLPFKKGDKRRIKTENKTLSINTNHRDCKLTNTNKEKLLFALSLILKNLITDEIFEDVSDEIHEIKKLSK